MLARSTSLFIAAFEIKLASNNFLSITKSKGDVEMKEVYRIATYEIRTSEYTKDVEVVNSDIRELSFVTVEDAKLVAKLANLKSFGVFKIKFNKDNYESISIRDNDRVFVTPDVIEGELTEASQRERDKNKKNLTIKNINALPKTVRLYLDKDFNITATRTDADDSYRGLDVHYSMKIMFKDEELSSWNKYVNDAGQVLKKKFVKDIYEREFADKKSWETELNNIPVDYVAKKSLIIVTAVKKLNEMNKKIDDAKYK